MSDTTKPAPDDDMDFLDRPLTLSDWIIGDDTEDTLTESNVEWFDDVEMPPF